MEEQTYTVTLTEQERERLVSIVACNLDLNIIPNMQEHAKRGDTEQVLKMADIIKLDRNLNEKLLNAK